MLCTLPSIVDLTNPIIASTLSVDEVALLSIDTSLAEVTD
jgi:hypothetical protein